VGVATSGGRFPPEWRDLLKECIAHGLDIENGLHEFVSEDDELVEVTPKSISIRKRMLSETDRLRNRKRDKVLA